MTTLRHLAFVGAGAVALGAAPLAAQTAAPQGAPVVGCRGYSFNSTTDAAGLPISFPEITELQPGSPAELAGIKRGDLIVANNGVSIFAFPPPPAAAPGETVVMTLRRDGRDVELRVVLGKRDAPKDENDVGLCRPLPKTP